MILPTPSLAALTAALFVSSVASRPTDGSNRCVKRKQATENDLVSIRYPSGEVRPIVDNVWFNGTECAKQGFDQILPHECLYHRVCSGPQLPWLFEKCEADPKGMVYERSEVTVVCAYDILCTRDKKPPQQSKEDQEREKAKETIETKCRGTEHFFDNRVIKKECAYKRAIALGRKNTLYADVYHDDKDGKVCFHQEQNVKALPDECILWYVEKLDKEHPPPTQGGNESEKPSETTAEQSSDTVAAQDEETKNDLVSIRYPSGEVRPLVDNVWYSGVECTSISPGRYLPHECLYHRICHGSTVPILLACINPPDYFQKMDYERSEIDSQSHCAFRMLCLRDTKPPQQSPEDQEKEKAKKPFLTLALPLEKSS